MFRFIIFTGRTGEEHKIWKFQLMTRLIYWRKGEIGKHVFGLLYQTECLSFSVQGSEGPWIYEGVLESPWNLLAVVWMDIFWKFFDIKKGHFVELTLFMSYKAVWNSSYHLNSLTSVFNLISNAFFLQAFSPCVSWYMVLKRLWILFYSAWPARTIDILYTLD